jgi:hypothetical protein
MSAMIQKTITLKFVVPTALVLALGISIGAVFESSHGPMTEPAHFDSLPWTQADDDKLRKLAPTGLSSRAIGIRMNRTETAVRSRARQLQVILRKIRLEQLQMG